MVDYKESVTWSEANSTLIAVLFAILGVLGIAGLIELMGMYYTYTH